MFEQEQWPKSTQTESREPKISKSESRSAVEDLTKNFRNIALPLMMKSDPSSTRDAMAEEVEHNIDSPTAADDDVMLDQENEIDDD
jgi:hypothetical protein